MVRLTKREVERALLRIPGWRVRGKGIRKRFPFASYARALAFTNRVARLAEHANHHPDLTLSYGGVTIVLTTHDEGGLTRRDTRLARRIEALAHKTTTRARKGSK